MRETTVARNYAETLAALATRAGELEGWGQLIDEVATAVQSDERLRRFLESPQVDVARKNAIISAAFADRLPRLFVRFIQAVVEHRRQHLIPDIASEYHAIVDEARGRVHAQVTVARQPDAASATEIASQLSRSLGKTVIPHFIVRPDILGGAIVRVGDRIVDGSVRRRLATLRARMLGGIR